MKIFSWIKQLTKDFWYEILARVSTIPKFVECPIPFCCQYARKEDVESFVKREKNLIEDPYWHLTGAKSQEEYAKWSRSICGMATTKTALKYFKDLDFQLIPLAKDAFVNGVYSEEKGVISDMKYREFSIWIEKYGLKAEIYSRLSIKGIKYSITLGKILIVSVNPNIRGYFKSNPKKRGGHLVVVTGYDDRKHILFLNNSSGFLSLQTQERHKIAEKEFVKYYAGRGITISLKD